MKWTIDSAHSAANFKVKHMGIAWVNGSFFGIDGEISFDPEKINEASFEGKIDVATLTTGHAHRDGHLKGDDFFNVEKFPTMDFSTESVEKIDENSAKVHGNLTIAGVSKAVTLNAALLGVGQKIDANGATEDVAAFTLTTEIDRTDFGLTWNVDLPNGVLLVGNKVTIEVNIEAIKQK